MRTTKDSVYEFVQKELYANAENTNGLETKYVADTLNMQRSNVSAILNELVKEGKLVKSSTRPVYYKLNEPSYKSSDESCFTSLVGHNGSLKNAVKLAKAAILYPRSGMHMLLVSKPGCGTTYFASLMYRFAQENGLIKADIPFVKINCRHYQKNVSVLSEDLFGIKGDMMNSCFARAQGGMLFIDNVDLLDAKQQSRLFVFLETGNICSEDNEEVHDFHDVLVVMTCTPQSSLQISRKIPVVIEMPELNERPLNERFELINYFFSKEANYADRSIDVTVETIEALLLTEFSGNIKELELEIKSACANGYVRVVNELDQDISVCLDDCKKEIKMSLLKLKDNHEEIDELLGMSGSAFYDKNKGYQDYKMRTNDNDMYIEIKKQYDELANRGISSSSIEDVINTHIRNLFKKYRYYNVQDDSNNLEQLSKIVDKRLIDLVAQWLNGCKKELGRSFKTNVFYGLCLHINSLLTLNFTHQRIDNQQVIKIIQEYPQEYAASVQFADILKENMNLELPIDEIVLITMFLIESDESNTEGHPVLLYILHGKDTASSLRDVTNSLTHCNNAYSYDLNLEIKAAQAMEEIKAMILKINNGQGVIIIYDMGSIKTMIDTISEEIDVKIRYMNIPITLVGIDVARKCFMETDIDYVYHMANQEINNMKDNEEKRNKIIITLCHTGEGGAMQLKHYIDQYSKLGMKVFALSISARDELLKEVLALQKTYRIHTFVGTYDPKLFGIPFVSIGKILENDKVYLDRILMFEPIDSKTVDYNEVYKYLEEQFRYVSIPKLKTVLPGVIDEFSTVYALSEDQRVGLFMHLACLMERLLEGDSANKNDDKNKLLTVFQEDYRLIRKIIKTLEKAFKVIVDDNELATIIMIVNRI
ncbi:PRD domain-containing protein [Dielma fastidiosa]|uniref:PRD domain-containing protein n=1 Tax=Dielma fastidiosa TaxID=1034346 RepID=UPI000D7A8D65|nr:PRD domain-containing protein [Dielma fastidiosa]PWM59985.1 MAG: transcriptional regulator [Dielma fastidiosa]